MGVSIPGDFVLVGAILPELPSSGGNPREHPPFCFLRPPVHLQPGLGLAPSGFLRCVAALIVGFSKAFRLKMKNVGIFYCEAQDESSLRWGRLSGGNRKGEDGEIRLLQDEIIMHTHRIKDTS
jgi:hypothetical protein